MIMSLWTKYHKSGYQVKNGWVCDSCDGWNNRTTKFCPHCGTPIKGKMQEPKTSSVDEFIEASDWTDWINQFTEDVYTIYWRWCTKNDHPCESKVVFMRKVLSEFPELKSVPWHGKRRFRKT